MDEHPKQEIAENSSGIQAHGDITITSGIKGDALLPVLYSLGSDISAVKTMVGEIREQQRSENLRTHLENLRSRLQATDNLNRPSAEKAPQTIRETELVDEWMEEVSKIDPSEEVLSEIWREWMVNLAAGKDSSDLSLILATMKKLTPAHGKLLLVLREKDHDSFRKVSFSSLQLAYLKDLENLGVITINRRLSEFGIVASFVIGLIILLGFMLSSRFAVSVGEVLDNVGSPLVASYSNELIQAILIIVVSLYALMMVRSRFFSARVIVTHYELSEIGKHIVSFARSKSNEGKNV